MRTCSNVTWRDIVSINGEYFLEEFPVSFENPVLNSLKFPKGEDEILNMIEDYDNGVEDCIYDCSNFFEEVRKKYKLPNTDDIETYLFDDIDLPEEITKKIDIAWLGGYINGFNI